MFGHLKFLTDVVFFLNKIKTSFIFFFHWAIGLMSRVFANGPEVIPKTQKMILDAALHSALSNIDQG